ncbi:hypothetical protein H0B58_002104 [Listeria monocytogenes]|nr:hypothetical protein [Listeria monocytogenes]EFQ5018654.1 hypothetical protein [Listeria monocytogenes]EGK9406113.1 hypothetical protein [Listeria monocytogenes]EGO6307829.1 hypothetical protein [Listeria monocytogenes]EHW1517846.1 hypothetical protein [Listeria monocytogenes]
MFSNIKKGKDKAKSDNATKAAEEATDLRIGKQKASFSTNNPMGSLDLEKMK